METMEFVQNGNVLIGRFLCEEIVANHIHEVKSLLLAKVDAGHTLMVLNLSKIRFLYSDVLEIFIGVSRELEKHNGRLVICGLQKVIEEIFAVTRLDAFFEITHTEEAALESLGGQPDSDASTTD